MSTKTQTKSFSPCYCGCGFIASSGSLYKPGHDAKHVSVLLKDALSNQITFDDARSKLTTQAIRLKFELAYLRALAKLDAKSAKLCVVCTSRRRSTKQGENPELCSKCFEEAGYENDHYDGNHDAGSLPTKCPLCKTGEHASEAAINAAIAAGEAATETSWEIKIGRWWYPVTEAANLYNDIFAVVYVDKKGETHEVEVSIDKLRQV